MVKYRHVSLMSFFITLCMVLGMGLSVCVYADGTTSVKLEQTNVTISGIAETGTMVTCIVLRKGYEDINAINTAEVSEAYYYHNECEVTDRMYRFAYKMLDNDDSGDYLVFVGGDGSIPQGIPYYYASATDRQTALLRINGAVTEDDLESILTGNEDLKRVFEAMGFLIERYSNLSDLSKADVDEKLFRNGADYTGGSAASEAVETFNKAVAVALVNGSTKEKILDVIEKNNDVLQLDLSNTSLYKGLGKDEAKLIGQAIYDRLPFTLIADVKNAFEQEVRIPYLNRIAYGDIFAFIQTHHAFFNIDLSKYTALDDTGKTYVSKKMAEKTFINAEDACTEYLNFIKSAPSNPKPSSGGNGGGGRTTKILTDLEVTAEVPKNDMPIQTDRFSDLQNAIWAKDSILKLADLGVVSGDGNGAFRPNDLIKREEFLKLAIEALGLVEQDADCNFADVSKEQWYYKYVATGVLKKIVNGLDEYTFGIGNPITRQDMASLAYRCAKLAGIEMPESNELTFTDSGDIASYAQGSIASLNKSGVISGTEDGSFAPRETATRAQACKIISKLLDLKGTLK